MRNYEEFIKFLKTNNVFKTTISLFRSNKDSIINQNKSWNISVSAEFDIFHFVKSLKVNGSKYIVKKHKLT